MLLTYDLLFAGLSKSRSRSCRAFYALLVTVCMLSFANAFLSACLFAFTYRVCCTLLEVLIALISLFLRIILVGVIALCNYWTDNGGVAAALLFFLLLFILSIYFLGAGVF